MGVTDSEIGVGGNLISTGNMTHDLGTLNKPFRYVYSQHVVLTSDQRKKKDIEKLDYGLDEVLKLNPVSYKWKHTDSDERSLGLLAQEVELVIEESVKTFNDANQSKVWIMLA